MTQEHRKYIRVPRNVEIVYRFFHQNTWHEGTSPISTLDIGGGGLCINASHELVAGSYLYLQVPLAPIPVYSMGKVIWVRPADSPGTFLAGVEFISLQERDRERIMRFVADLQERPNPLEL